MTEEVETNKNVNLYQKNYKEIKKLLEECVEKNKVYPYLKKFRINGNTVFLTYFTNLGYEEIISQLNFNLEFKGKFKSPTYIVSSYYGREITSTNKMHIHIYLKLNRIIDLTKPDIFDLKDTLSFAKISGHYEKCRDPEAAIWYLRYHAENNIKNDVITTLRDINLSKDADILNQLSRYYLSCFEKGNSNESCLDETMKYFLSNYKEKTSLYTSIRSSLKERMKLETKSLISPYSKDFQNWKERNALSLKEKKNLNDCMDLGIPIYFSNSPGWV